MWLSTCLHKRIAKGFWYEWIKLSTWDEIYFYNFEMTISKSSIKFLNIFQDNILILQNIHNKS